MLSIYLIHVVFIGVGNYIMWSSLGLHICLGDIFTHYSYAQELESWYKQYDAHKWRPSRNRVSPHQLSYVTNSGEGEGLVFYGSTIIPFKDKFDNSLMLYALMTSKPDEVEKRKKLGIGERDD